MKKRLITHGIAVMGIAVFAFLAIASSVTSAAAPTPAPVSGGATSNTNASTVNTGFPCTGSWKVTGRDSKSWMGDLVITGFNGNGFAGYFAWYYSPGNEFVGYENFAGEYNPQSGAVTIRGFSVTDSSRLALGEYQARLSGNGLHLVSGTWAGGGVWQANFVSRDAPAQGSTGTVATQPPGPTPAAPSPPTPPAPPAPDIAGTPAQGNNLAEKLAWLSAFVQSNTSYILDVNTDESIGDQTLEYSGKSNVTINLRGIGANRRVNGSFNVRSGVTLVLHNNITLQDIGVNGGTLIMNAGVTARHVGVGSGATFTMNGGTISGNTVSYRSGGGVNVAGGGTFTMNGGTISGNTVRANAAGEDHGGGVLVGNRGTFTMNGGTISGNTAGGGGGGVSVFGGTFTMSGGTISGNTASGGGGVRVLEGTFTMNGGEISGNTSSYIGGGVLVGGRGTFTMRNGTVSGNTARENGGGVFVGGVDSFTKTGGTITGYASDQRNGNAVKDSSGDVQNYRGHAVAAPGPKIKEGTAGPGDNMSFNGTRNPPTASGAWDN